MGLSGYPETGRNKPARLLTKMAASDPLPQPRLSKPETLNPKPYTPKSSLSRTTIHLAVPGAAQGSRTIVESSQRSSSMISRPLY